MKWIIYINLTNRWISLGQCGFQHNVDSSSIERESENILYKNIDSSALYRLLRIELSGWLKLLVMNQASWYIISFLFTTKKKGHGMNCTSNHSIWKEIYSGWRQKEVTLKIYILISYLWIISNVSIKSIIYCYFIPIFWNIFYCMIVRLC